MGAEQIEPPKARALAESLEIPFREQEQDLATRLMTKIIKWMFFFGSARLPSLSLHPRSCSAPEPQDRP